MSQRPKRRRARKSATRKPQTSREKVRAHRERLRAQGLRPVTLWVPDTRSDAFKKEAHRQCVLVNRSPHAEQDQAWADGMVEDGFGAR